MLIKKVPRKILFKLFMKTLNILVLVNQKTSAKLERIHTPTEYSLLKRKES